jgi:hypothetical protein
MSICALLRSRSGQQSECSGVKLHDFGEVRQEIVDAVISRIRVIFVFYVLLLEFAI